MEVFYEFSSPERETSEEIKVEFRTIRERLDTLTSAMQKSCDEGTYRFCKLLLHSVGTINSVFVNICPF